MELATESAWRTTASSASTTAASSSSHFFSPDATAIAVCICMIMLLKDLVMTVLFSFPLSDTRQSLMRAISLVSWHVTPASSQFGISLTALSAKITSVDSPERDTPTATVLRASTATCLRINNRSEEGRLIASRCSQAR
ncbi:hypothetical protein D3C73_636010 [compost metagenome]